MRLIVNTNRIIAALVKDSYSRKIIMQANAELITIRLSAEEIQKHFSEIGEKSALSSEEIELLLGKFAEKLILLDDLAVQRYMDEAKDIMDSIDKDDTPFIAAALAADAPIWSDDHHFQQQSRVKVYRTKELGKLWQD